MSSPRLAGGLSIIKILALKRDSRSRSGRLSNRLDERKPSLTAIRILERLLHWKWFYPVA